MVGAGGRFALGDGTGVTEGEEPRAAPGRAGDGAGDRRQARIGRAQPVEAIAHHRDGVALSVRVRSCIRPLSAAVWPLAIVRFSRLVFGRSPELRRTGSNSAIGILQRVLAAIRDSSDISFR